MDAHGLSDNSLTVCSPKRRNKGGPKAKGSPAKKRKVEEEEERGEEEEVKEEEVGGQLLVGDDGEGEN